MNGIMQQCLIKVIEEKLVGKKIIGVATSPNNGSVGFVLDNKTIAWVDRDAEGNGIGWLAVEKN